MRVFFDTNVLVYLFDSADAQRHARAVDRFAHALAHEHIVLSTQVLHEFFHIVTRKLRPALPPAEAALQVQRLCQFEVVGSHAQSVQDATALMQQHRLSWWDALILEAALRANAEVLLTEDGQPGRRFGALRVDNPLA